MDFTLSSGCYLPINDILYTGVRGDMKHFSGFYSFYHPFLILFAVCNLQLCFLVFWKICILFLLCVLNVVNVFFGLLLCVCKCIIITQRQNPLTIKYTKKQITFMKRLYTIPIVLSHKTMKLCACRCVCVCVGGFVPILSAVWGNVIAMFRMCHFTLIICWVMEV